MSSYSGITILTPISGVLEDFERAIGGGIFVTIRRDGEWLTDNFLLKILPQNPMPPLGKLLGKRVIFAIDDRGAVYSLKGEVAS